VSFVPVKSVGFSPCQAPGHFHRYRTGWNRRRGVVDAYTAAQSAVRVPRFTRHSRRVSSNEPVTHVWASTDSDCGTHATPVTASVWPASVTTNSPDVFHTRAAWGRRGG
jgi:hypothetical protein